MNKTRLNCYNFLLTQNREAAEYFKLHSERDQNISGAFIWLGTPQGHDFWSALYFKYTEWKREEKSKTPKGNRRR